MNRFINGCFRIGLLCGIGALACGVVVSFYEFGLTLPPGLRSFAESAFAILGLSFMLLGFVLLFAAVGSLRAGWSKVPPSVGIFIALGLLVTTFLGGYIFHFLAPKFSDRQQSG